MVMVMVIVWCCRRERERGGDEKDENGGFEGLGFRASVS